MSEIKGEREERETRIDALQLNHLASRNLNLKTYVKSYSKIFLNLNLAKDSEVIKQIKKN